MRKVREILRLHHEVGLSCREIAASTGASLGVVHKMLHRAKIAALVWADVASLDEESLEKRLYGPRLAAAATRPLPDPVWIDVELRKTGVTLELLHLEYLQAHPDGYRYSRFCEVYRRWRARRQLTMRKTHRAGERAYVDYSGKRPHVINPKTGEHEPVELFVGVLGASNFTFAEATRSQKSIDFIGSNVRMLEHFGGAPSILVPDQLKSGVTTSCWYEPVIQRSYEELARHYGSAVIPARPRRPRDKAKVEAGVRIAQRWILARLRNEQFFSLDALNGRIAVLLDELNAKPMKRYGGKSRDDLFAELDKPALNALPGERFVVSEWREARVNIDYHVDVDKHWYSVPHVLVHERVDIRLTAMAVEIFHRGQRVASHVRSRLAGRPTTEPAHMPKAHLANLDWPPSRIIEWAAKSGPDVAAFVKAILDENLHPEQGYRPCLGIIRLGKRYGDERLNKACKRAHLVGALSYRHVAAILKNQLEDAPLPSVDVDNERPPIVHENVRGADYYK